MATLEILWGDSSDDFWGDSSDYFWSLGELLFFLTDIVGFEDSTYFLSTEYDFTIVDSIGFDDILSNNINFYNFLEDSCGFRNLYITNDFILAFRGRTKIPRIAYGGTGYGEVISYGDGFLSDIANYLIIVKDFDGIVLREETIEIDDFSNPDCTYIYSWNMNEIDNGGFSLSLIFEAYQVNLSGIRSIISSIDYFRDIICGGYSLPSDIPNLITWLDASQLLLNDGDTVDSFTDLSGSGLHLNNKGGSPKFRINRINNLPSVVFTPSDYLYNTYDYVAVRPITIIYLARLTGGQNKVILSARSSDFVMGYAYYGDVLDDAYYCFGWLRHGGIGADTNWHVHEGVVRFNVRGAFRMDGITLADGIGEAGSYGAPVNLCINQRNSVSNSGSYCEFVEGMIYLGELGTAYLEQIRDYLTYKYKLTIF